METRVYTTREVWLGPWDRNGTIFVSAMAAFFVVQYLAHPISSRISRTYRTLSKDQQVDWCVRVVAIVHSLVSLNSLVCFFDMPEEAYGNTYYLYERYNPFLAITTGYFLWDIVVCIRYRWGAAYTCHAFLSAFATWNMNLPFCHRYSTYYCGVFEATNLFIHASEIMKITGSTPRLRDICNYIFGLSFVFIRCIGGSIIAVMWWIEMYALVTEGKAHDNFIVVVLCIMELAIQVLQFVWLRVIVRAAMGIEEGGDAKSPKSPNRKNEKQFPEPKKMQ